MSDCIPWLRLAAAILARAVRDAQSGGPDLAAEARAWLEGAEAHEMAACLGLDRGLARWLGGM